MRMSRRHALSVLATIPALGLMGKALSHPLSVEGDSDVSVDDWMQDWMPRGSVKGALRVMRFADSYYATTKDIAWKPEKGDESLPPVTVPPGFVTDFASIPRVFWSLLRPDGQYTYAAIIHDYLYWTQTTSREIADEIFKAVMKEFNVPGSSITAIFNAVRLGGSSAWNSNARAKKRGELRILAKLPEDPKVRWADWKLQAHVFDEKSS